MKYRIVEERGEFVVQYHVPEYKFYGLIIDEYWIPTTRFKSYKEARNYLDNLAKPIKTLYEIEI